MILDTLFIDSLWATAKLWRAGSNVQKVDSARQIITSTPGAVSYVVRKYLPQDDRLQTRAIRDICLKLPDTCAPAVEHVLLLKDTIAQKNALYVASEVRMPSLEKTLQLLLRKKKKDRWKARILRALYKSGSSASCREVVRYLRHRYVYARMRAALFMGEHSCSSYRDRLWKLLGDDYFVVRDAAKESLIKLGFTPKEIGKYYRYYPLEILKLLFMKCPSPEYKAQIKPKGVYQEFWFKMITCAD